MKNKNENKQNLEKRKIDSTVSNNLDILCEYHIYILYIYIFTLIML